MQIFASRRERHASDPFNDRMIAGLRRPVGPDGCYVGQHKDRTGSGARRGARSIRTSSGAKTGARLIRRRQTWKESVAIVAPVPQVVHPNFEHLQIAVVGGERVAGQERSRDRNGERSVAQPAIVILELQRPMGRKHPFGARADQPAASGVVAVSEVGQGRAAERHVRRKVGDAQAVAADPAAAGLAVEQQLIDGIAKARSHGRDPVQTPPQLAFNKD